MSRDKATRRAGRDGLTPSSKDQAGDARIRATAAGGVGLLIVDMVNDMRFEGAAQMRDRARRAADVILNLRSQADALGAPVVYVNDNYGLWHSERSRIIRHCREGGAELLSRIEPRRDDYFVIKPQMSGFYATNLAVLLPKLGVNRLVLTGIAADICVLFTASDAHMRAYDLWVPSDAVASSREAHSDWALQIMRKSMGAETRPTVELSLACWSKRAPSEPDISIEGERSNPERGKSKS